MRLRDRVLLRDKPTTLAGIRERFTRARHAAINHAGIPGVPAGAGTALFFLITTYGAVGDDSTDCTSAFNSAIAAAKAAGGGYVYIPAGIYRVSALIAVPTGIIIIGEGFLSVVKPVGLTGGDRAVFGPENNNAPGWQLHNFTIYGNYSAGGPCHGVNINMTGLDTTVLNMGPDAHTTLSNLYIYGCGTNTKTYSGIWIHSATSHARVMRLDKLIMRENDAHHILIEGSSDNIVTNVVGGSCDGTGLKCTGANNIFEKVKMFFCNVDGFDISGSRNEGGTLHAQDCGQHGFNITGQDFTGTGCHADSNGRLLTGAGFYLGADGIVLSGLHSMNGSSSTQHYGMQLASALQNCMISGRIDSGMVTAQMSGSFNQNSIVNLAMAGTTPLIVPTPPAGSTDTIPLAFGKTGTLSVGTGTSRQPIIVPGDIIAVRAMVATAPTGSSLIVDVHKNGTTIFTTQGNRPTISAGSNDSGNEIPDVVGLLAGDYLTIDIDQVGSTVAGVGLTLAIEYRKT